MKLKEDYTLASCCNPVQSDAIVGYYSHNNIIKVHKAGCSNLQKADQSRLVSLEWKNILTEDTPKPLADYDDLTAADFAVMLHHEKYGVDYSLKVAAVLHIDKQAVFDSHARLRNLELLERVEPRIIQYRKGIVDNKWIKHRNHTYYDLTPKGRLYLEHYRKR